MQVLLLAHPVDSQVLAWWSFDSFFGAPSWHVFVVSQQLPSYSYEVLSVVAPPWFRLLCGDEGRQRWRRWLIDQRPWRRRQWPKFEGGQIGEGKDCWMDPVVQYSLQFIHYLVSDSNLRWKTRLYRTYYLEQFHQLGHWYMCRGCMMSLKLVVVEVVWAAPAPML